MRVKTRSLNFAGNDPASFPPHHSICSISCRFVSPVCPYGSEQSFTSGSPLLVKQFVLLYELRIVLCQLPVMMSVKHSLSGDTSSYGRLHWGQTRQKIHSSLAWPLDVVCWHDMGLGGVWGEEASLQVTTHGSEVFSLKTPWQGNKAKAVIFKHYNHWVHVIHRNWSHLCLQCLGLWSSSRAECSIEHCWRRVWNPSNFVITATQIWHERYMYMILEHTMWSVCTLLGGDHASEVCG